MSVIRATQAELGLIRKITANTISAVYPHYYPAGAVEFFLKHHREENIARDIERGEVYLCLGADGEPVGTVTVSGCEINRLFVLPERQGMGYGRELLTFAEGLIFGGFDDIELHASLPAKAFYLRHGYVMKEYRSAEVGHGDFLCVDIMTKKKK